MPQITYTTGLSKQTGSDAYIDTITTLSNYLESPEALIRLGVDNFKQLVEQLEVTGYQDVNSNTVLKIILSDPTIVSILGIDWVKERARYVIRSIDNLLNGSQTLTLVLKVIINNPQLLDLFGIDWIKEAADLLIDIRSKSKWEEFSYSILWEEVAKVILPYVKHNPELVIKLGIDWYTKLFIKCAGHNSNYMQSDLMGSTLLHILLTAEWVELFGVKNCQLMSSAVLEGQIGYKIANEVLPTLLSNRALLEMFGLEKITNWIIHSTESPQIRLNLIVSKSFPLLVGLLDLAKVPEEIHFINECIIRVANAIHQKMYFTFIPNLEITKDVKLTILANTFFPKLEIGFLDSSVEQQCQELGNQIGLSAKASTKICTRIKQHSKFNGYWAVNKIHPQARKKC